MMKEHGYQVQILWTGNEEEGTRNYTSYQRDHVISRNGKQHEIKGSSDSSFRGDPSRFNPEELFLSSISACHMLWYLHLCSANKIVVTDYKDRAEGVMMEYEKGSGKFTEVTLHPSVTIENADHMELAKSLHEDANQMCFIANSCNFPIHHVPEILAQ